MPAPMTAEEAERQYVDPEYRLYPAARPQALPERYRPGRED